MQVSIIVPLLKWATAAHVVFYGHFPDLHLATRASPLRRVYRRPFDALEGASTAAAHTLLVNSRFTLDTFAATFPRLAAARSPRILYPAVAVPSEEELAADQASWESGAPPTPPPPGGTFAPSHTHAAWRHALLHAWRCCRLFETAPPP